MGLHRLCIPDTERDTLPVSDFQLYEYGQRFRSVWIFKFPGGYRLCADREFFVQKNFVFKSNAAFSQAVPKYIGLAVLLVVVSAALPAYSQTWLVNFGVPQRAVPTLANVVNIIASVVLSYPAMKFWIMPKHA